MNTTTWTENWLPRWRNDPEVSDYDEYLYFSVLLNFPSSSQGLDEKQGKLIGRSYPPTDIKFYILSQLNSSAPIWRMQV